MVREKLCVLCVIASIINDHNNNVCQASTSSSEEITKIKPVFFVVFLTLKQLSAFAITQTFNM